MDTVLKWKYDKEITCLKKKIEDLEKIMRIRRKVIADGIVIPVERRGFPGVDKKKVYEDAFAVDEELQGLIVDQKQLEEKIEAWNILLRFGIKKLPNILMDQLLEEYDNYQRALLSDAVNKLFVYDSANRRFISTYSS